MLVMDNETHLSRSDLLEKDSDEIKKFVKNNYWKIRPCQFYDLEYSECKLLRSRFHQYFINGDFSDCSSWKKDASDCEKCSQLDYKACINIIFNEDERKKNRMEGHLANDVWKKRKEPPPEWNKELPEWFYEKNKDSFLMKEYSDHKCVIF